MAIHSERPDDTHLPEFAIKTPEFTRPPNPDWKPGDGLERTEEGRKWLEGETKGWTEVDVAKEQPIFVYKLLISAITPRPIAFVSTVSENGEHNLTPFSWFNMVCALPPIIFICCSNYPERVHDSTKNILATKQFCVNIISEAFIQNANFSSVDAPEGFSEWRGSGLTMAPNSLIKPPRVKESAFSMECELYNNFDTVLPNGLNTNTVMFGLIKKVHIRNDVLLENKMVDPTALKPVARLGDIAYSRLGDLFRIARPTWKESEAEVRALEEEAEKVGLENGQTSGMA